MLIIIQTIKIKNGLFRCTKKMEQEAREIYLRLIKFYERTHYKKNATICLGVTYNPTISPTELQIYIMFENSDNLDAEKEKEIFLSRIGRILLELELFSTYESHFTHTFCTSSVNLDEELRKNRLPAIEKVCAIGFSIKNTFSAKVNPMLAENEMNEELFQWGMGTRFFVRRRIKEAHLTDAQLKDHIKKLSNSIRGVPDRKLPPNPLEFEENFNGSSRGIKIHNVYINLLAQGFIITVPGLLSSISENLESVILQRLKSLNIDFYEVVERMGVSYGIMHKPIDDPEGSYLGEYFLRDLPSHDEIPHEFFCSISMRIMDLPVALEGCSAVVDRVALDYSLLCNPDNPYTRQPLHLSECKPLPDLRKKIHKFVKDQVSKSLDRGDELFKNKNYDEAIRFYISALNYYGHAMGKLETYKKEENKQSYNHRNNSYLLLRKIGNCYYLLNDFRNAIKILIIILMKQKDFALNDERLARIQLDLACCYKSNGNHQAALKHLHFSHEYFQKTKNNEKCDHVSRLKNQWNEEFKIIDMQNKRIEKNPKVAAQLLPFLKFMGPTSLVLDYLGHQGKRPRGGKRPNGKSRRS